MRIMLTGSVVIQFVMQAFTQNRPLVCSNNPDFSDGGQR
jgi:hypothetical protein